MIKTLTALFINGRVFLRASAVAAAGAEDLPAIGSALKEPGVAPRFVTHFVEKQLRQRYVFFFATAGL